MTEYTLGCPFCGKVHSSPFWDVLEGEVMGCRDLIGPLPGTTIEDWEGQDTIPVRGEPL